MLRATVVAYAVKITLQIPAAGLTNAAFLAATSENAVVPIVPLIVSVVEALWS